MSYAGVRLTSCGTSRASTAFLVSCTALILHLCSIVVVLQPQSQLVWTHHLFLLKLNPNLSNLGLQVSVLLLKILTSVLWKLEFSTGIGNTYSAMPQLEPSKMFLQDDNITWALFLSPQIPRQGRSSNRSKINPIQSEKIIREDLIVKMNSSVVVINSIIWLGHCQ